jgi:hypothetical protein
LAQHFCTVCSGWQKAQQNLAPTVAWLDRSIGAHGLLLVLAHLFAVPILALWMGLEKSK